MTFQGDPYRTLGILPGASLNEIRSAYRRLAKQYHPDAAGERALPRFLAIQAAYERLVDGEGRLRSWSAGGRGTAPARGPDPAAPRDEPWRADPARARASRDAWRARRSTRGAATGTNASGAESGAASGGAEPGVSGTEWARAGAGGSRRRTPGAGGPARGDGRRGERPGRRGPRKATPGSTTYDEAAETPRDPEWAGGAWYGPSSGTYWTINPREYADPRKHGPEYLARARRAAGLDGGPEATVGEGLEAEGPGSDRPRGAPRPVTPGPTADTDGTGHGGDWRWNGTARTTTDGGEGDWATRSWAYDPTDAAGSIRADRAGREQAGADRTGWVSGDPGMPDLEALARRASPAGLLALSRRGDVRWRLVLALVGWPPIGFAVGSLISSLTGCASFSASCPEPLPLVPIVVQPLVVGTLFLVGPLAVVATFGTLIALAVALPVAAVLAVGTVPESRVGAPVLGAVVAIAYVIALVAGTRAISRSDPGEGRPPP